MKAPSYRLFYIRFDILLDSFSWFSWSKYLHLFHKINRWLQNSFDNWKNYFSLGHDFWKRTDFQMCRWLPGKNIWALFDSYNVYTILIALKNTVLFIVSATLLLFLSKMSCWKAKSAGSVTGAVVIFLVKRNFQKYQNFWLKSTLKCFCANSVINLRRAINMIQWYPMSIFTCVHVKFYIFHTAIFARNVETSNMRKSWVTWPSWRLVSSVIMESS